MPPKLIRKIFEIIGEIAPVVLGASIAADQTRAFSLAQVAKTPRVYMRRSRNGN